MYIREAQIILLIYDISDRESFDSMPNWIQQVLDVKNSDVVFVLIGNKNNLENERKVTFEEGKKFAEENNFIFQEVSAKNGNNFEKLFEVQIFEAIYNKFKKEFDKREKMGYEEQVNYETNNIQIIIMIIKLSWKQIIIIIRMVKKEEMLLII